MDREFMGAAEEGHTETLYSLLRLNPTILKEIDETPFAHTPLHMVASHGDHEQIESSHGVWDDNLSLYQKRAEFAIEIAILMPSFTRKLNSEGETPMHLALSKCAWTTVRALMNHDPELVRVKGKGGKTPLHVAAEYAPPQLLAELLFACPSAVEDVTARWKTAMHIAVDERKLESFKVLFQWLSSVDQRKLLTWQDIGGNTVLHEATRTNQIEVVKRLVNVISDDTENFSREKAITIYENAGRLQIREEIGSLLRGKKPGIFEALFNRRCEVREYLALTEAKTTWRRIARACEVVQVRNDNVRNVLIIVATLVATTTYQGVLSPPGGFWQDSSSPSSSSSNTTPPHSAGKMIMDVSLISNFIPYNTFAFGLSVWVLIVCVPAHLLFGAYLLLAVFALLFTYKFALHSIVSPGVIARGTTLPKRSQVDYLTTGMIIVAAIILLPRIVAFVISGLVFPKSRLAERGLTRSLLRPIERDGNGQTNNHIDHGSEENHAADAAHLRGPEGP